MQSISDDLRTFISKYLMTSLHVCNWNYWLFCPFVEFKADVFYCRSTIRISWVSGIGYYPDMEKFSIICTNIERNAGIYCLVYDFKKLNRKFDGNADSIVNYMDKFNSLRDDCFRHNAFISNVVVGTTIDVRLCDKLKRVETIRLV